MKAALYVLFVLLLPALSHALLYGSLDLEIEEEDEAPEPKLKGSVSVVDQEDDTGARALQGYYGKGPKGGSKFGGGCYKQRFFYKAQQLKRQTKEIKGNNNDNIGFFLDQIPFYKLDGRGGREAGVITETSILARGDCTVQGAFSFRTDNKGTSKDQVFYQGALLCVRMALSSDFRSL